MNAVLADLGLRAPTTTFPVNVLRLHPEADAVPSMTPDEYDAFAVDVDTRGITTPLTITPHGVILDGRHRYSVAITLGIEDVPVHVVNVPPDRQVDYMVRQAVLRRHLTIAQRRDLAGAMLRENPGQSDRQVATVVGLSHPTVADVRSELVAAGDVEEVSTRLDSLGRLQPVRLVSAPRDDRWNPGGLMSSVSAEWHTPAEVIERVTRALGTIDLDPCAEEARGVPAGQHYTEAEDGLTQPWRGRVYMNPPYGTVIGDWIDKLAAEVKYGNVTEAIALLPARTDTAWWTRLPSEALCFVTGRLRFSGMGPAPFPSVAAYLGTTPDGFLDAFADAGVLYRRVTR